MTEVPFGEESAGEWVDTDVDRVDQVVDQAVGREAGTAEWEDPADRPWTPIPRPARSLEPGLIPAQRRLKKTSRSA